MGGREEGIGGGGGGKEASDVATVGGCFRIWPAGLPRWVYIELNPILNKAAMAELARGPSAVSMGLGSIPACCKFYILS